MKTIFKSIFLKVSYNPTIKKVANKVFIYFPKLKTQLLALRDSSYMITPKKNIYMNDFLETIKKEVEDKKGIGK